MDFPGNGNDDANCNLADLEQIVNAVVSIIGASYLLEMGKKWRKKRAMTLWHMHMEQQEERLERCAERCLDYCSYCLS